MASSQEVVRNVDNPQDAAGNVIDATALAKSTVLADPKL